jgi:hypothetical protein
MTIPQLIWLAGLFITSITINTGLLKVVTDDKFERPNAVSLIINSLFSLVGGFFGILLVGIFFSVIFVLFNALSFLLLFYFTKIRTVQGLELGEKLLIQFKTIDLQICYILAEIHGKERGNLIKPITLALRYILSEMPTIIGLDNTHHSELSVLIPKENKFKVVAYSGIENYRVEKMEEMFHYGSNTVSLAGHAMNQRKPIIVNDLADDTNPNLEHWIKTHRDEPKRGSLLAFPIIRGLGASDAEPIAILCITSMKKNAFKNADSVIRLLNYYALKIEILQNCLDLTTILGSETGV